MDPFLHLCKILLLCSIILNFYLINLSIKQLSVEECFAVQKEYKFTLEEEIKKSEECLQREFLREKKGRITKPSTTVLPKYEEELKRHKMTESDELPNRVSNNFENNKLVRNCITGDVTGKINLTSFESQQLKEMYLKNKKTVPKETKKERLESFKNVFNSRAWGRDWDTSIKGMSASG